MIGFAVMRLLLVVILGGLAAGAGLMTKLFNGKTLRGWRQCNGTSSYSVGKGAIVGATAEGNPNSFLCAEKTYGDFVLEYEILGG